MGKSRQHGKQSAAGSIGRRCRLAVAGATALSLAVLLAPTAASAKPHSQSHHRAAKSTSKLAELPALPALPALPSGTRFYLTLALVAPPRTGDSSHLQALREALLKELQSLPGVVVATGAARVGAQLLQKHHVMGFYLDGTVQLQSSAGAGGQQISCQVQVTVATWPQRAVKMMSTQGAALQTGATAAEQLLGQRDCLMATAGLTREDIKTYLQTLP